MRIALQLDAEKASQLLARIERAGLNPMPVMLQIGEHLVMTTKDRFQTSRAPDGSAWAPNQPSTLQGYMSRFSGGYKKDGSLSARGARRLGGKKPLIGESRALSTTINAQAFGRAGVDIGSTMEYAAVHQFGAGKGSLGSTRRGAPIPWGDIPARPFLGISRQDQAEIDRLLADYLADAGG